VFILNRTPETAQKLARQAGAKTVKRDALAKQGFDVIINATPAGMSGNKTASILTPEELKARIVFDLVYNPIDTPLLKMARQKGIAVITGVEMFVQQGARQFEIWTGKPAPEEEMLRVVVHALRQNAENAGAETHAAANATRIDIGPREAGSHADYEPAAGPPPRVVGREESQVKPAKPAVKATVGAAAAKAAANGKAAGNGKSAAVKAIGKTNGKPNGKAKPVAKAAAKSEPARKLPAKATPKKVTKKSGKR
jgi:3-dehydroquinate dehydratase/shikimate dehydrogenase